MSYTPNFSDPRVRNRIEKAYNYALAHFDYEVDSAQSMQAISKRFGQAQTELARWLKSQLLVCTDHHYSEAAGLSKKYRLNAEGIKHIEQTLGIKRTRIESTVNTYTEEFKQEFETGNFNYIEKSNRFFHPVQFLKKDQKHVLFREMGYNHEYDIQACCPTLLYQEALKHDLLPQPAIEEYLSNRTAIRQKLAAELNCTPEQAKKIVNALFGGARVGVGEWFSLWKDLDRDTRLINAIKNNQYLNELRDSIRVMWQSLPVQDRRKSKQKMAMYFELELRVLKAVKKFLGKNGGKHLTEHDGWVCEFELDEYQLHRAVKAATGFSVKVSHICLRDVCVSAEAANEDVLNRCLGVSA